MKIARTVFLVLLLAGPIAAATDSARLAITSPDRLTSKEDLGSENPRWRFTAGRWVRRPSGGRQVLAQIAETQPWAVAILEDRRFTDVDIAVRFRPISGNEDASGGIIFRARDGENYLLVRANALENNFRLYTMIAGRRRVIASASVTPPKLGEWHTIRVVAVGDRIQAYLNDTMLLDRADRTFTSGYVGLWTKADSMTEFVDLEISGIPVN